jgi:hypothetical protein
VPLPYSLAQALEHCQRILIEAALAAQTTAPARRSASGCT